MSSVPLATKYKISERIRKMACTGQGRDALWVLVGCIWTKTEIWSFFTGWKKITLDGNTSWAPSDKNLLLWFSDSSLLELCVTPQSRSRLVRLWEKTDMIEAILVLIQEIEKQMHNGMLPSCNCWKWKHERIKTRLPLPVAKIWLWKKIFSF